MANIIESRVTLEDEVFEETIDTAEEPIEVVRPTSYNDLQDLPQINGVTLQGNKTSSDLGIVTQNDINSAVSAEATLRENADTALGGRIDQEITDRGNADTALGGRIDGEIMNRTNADNALGTRIDNEILARQGGDNNLQSQIDAITSKSDVVDVVATYADLQAYDTQHLGNNDVIKVLDDETHDDAQTYYRWNKTAGTWSYIGSEAPYYSKGQMDTMLQAKQDKIDATHKLSADLVTDTSTTNKFVTAEDKTNWNAKQDALTAGTGIDITSDVISTPAIVPEVVTELPTTGAEGKLYLTPKNYTAGTATGNPITISLGEDAGQITSAQLDGDTFQQSYTGKNLFPSSVTWTVNRAFPTSNQGEWANWAGYYGFLDYIEVEPDTTYTFSNAENLKFIYGLQYYDSGKNWISGDNNTQTFTTPSNCHYIRGAVSSSTEPTQCQLELGASGTSYEPYVGGVPSPNPDYPQQIQTVTGVQTVSINGTDYHIDLGSIELCKLGSYQDYIYKSGSDWKVHKATELWPITNNSSAKGYTWESPRKRIYLNPNAGDGLIFSSKVAAVADNDTVFPACANKLVAKSFNNIITDGINGFCLSQSKAMSFRNNAWTDETTARSQLDGTNVIYPLATPTDTAITDTNLIAQLEAVRNATLQASNTITNTATGTNLAGDLELGYYEYDPTNRYDKFIWLDLNNNYEKLGS